jgi:hypothetical protein
MNAPLPPAKDGHLSLAQRIALATFLSVVPACLRGGK